MPISKQEARDFMLDRPQDKETIQRCLDDIENNPDSELRRELEHDKEIIRKTRNGDFSWIDPMVYLEGILEDECEDDDEPTHDPRQCFRQQARHEPPSEN